MQRHSKAGLNAMTLLGSGAVSLLGFTVITSGRWEYIRPEVVTFLVTFAQWQVLAVTISCLGIKDAIFAAVSKDNAIRFQSAPFVLKKVVPAAAVCAIAAGFAFNSCFVSLFIFVSVVLDVISHIITADLNGRKRHKTVALGNLLNYPLFFMLLIVSSLYLPLSEVAVALLFTAVSVVRLLWLLLKSSPTNGQQVVRYNASVRMAFQQTLNYLMFRVDQLLLSATVLQATFFGREFLGRYIFLAKFPEIVAAVFSLAGVVLLPHIYLRYPLQRCPTVRLVLFAVLGAGALAGGLMFYLRVWAGATIPFAAIIPFFAHALLVIPANVVTYSMLRQGHLEALLQNVVASLLVGVVVTALFIFRADNFIFMWIVPSQLTVYVLLALAKTWGKSKPLYEAAYE